MNENEALSLTNDMSIAYHDSFDPNLPEEDREWNRIRFEELRDKIVYLLIKSPSRNRQMQDRSCATDR